MVIITDGRSNINVSATTSEAIRLKNETGATVYVVGVTSDILISELNAMATNTSTVLLSPDYQTLLTAAFLDQIVGKICVPNLNPASK